MSHLLFFSFLFSFPIFLSSLLLPSSSSSETNSESKAIIFNGVYPHAVTSQSPPLLLPLSPPPPFLSLCAGVKYCTERLCAMLIIALTTVFSHRAFYSHTVYSVRGIMAARSLLTCDATKFILPLKTILRIWLLWTQGHNSKVSKQLYHPSVYIKKDSDIVTTIATKPSQIQGLKFF